jgi:hypothetical protein
MVQDYFQSLCANPSQNAHHDREAAKRLANHP